MTARKKLIKIAIATGVLALILWIAAAMLIAIVGMTEKSTSADMAVVFGNTVLPDGSLSKRLQARVDTAYDSYQRKDCALIFVSGGIDPNGTDEAAAMKTYLVRKGVPQERIVTDNLGVNTHATAVNAAAYMQQHKLSSVLLVSQYFHLPRARQAFQAAGVVQIHAAYPVFFEARDVYSTLREVPALISVAVKS